MSNNIKFLSIAVIVVAIIGTGLFFTNGEKPKEERSLWTAQQAKESRADGLIFMYNWGCNYQTAVGRMIADIVKEETGIPSINIDVGELGRMEAPEQSENRVESFIEMLK